MIQMPDYMHRSCVKVPLEATAKEAAIWELVQLLSREIHLEDPSKLFATLLERERIVPQGTFMNEFVALPHCVGDFEGTHVCIGKPTQPIDWEHSDKVPTPVELIILAISDRKESIYVALGRFSAILAKVRMRERIRLTGTRDALIECLLQEDAAIADTVALSTKGVHLLASLK